MNPWPKYPFIYEINTWIWLNELGCGQKIPFTLATVPKKKWDAIAALGSDVFVRSGDEMAGAGMYGELPPWGYHLLACART